MKVGQSQPTKMNEKSQLTCQTQQSTKKWLRAGESTQKTLSRSAKIRLVVEFWVKVSKTEPKMKVGQSQRTKMNEKSQLTCQTQQSTKKWLRAGESTQKTLSRSAKIRLVVEFWVFRPPSWLGRLDFRWHVMEKNEFVLASVSQWYRHIQRTKK